MLVKREYKGKDVAEAIRMACEKLSVPREDLEIEIVETGSAGIFGLCKKKAKIKVSLKRGQESRAGNKVSAGANIKQKAKKFLSEKIIRKDRGDTPAVKVDEVPVIVGQETLDAVKRELDTIVKLMGYAVETSVSAEGNKIKAHLSGDDVEEIVGTEGQILDGLQFVLRKIISRKFPERLKFGLDAGDFRENRSKELEEMSLKLAGEVKETGKTRSIPALNPAERRIVHMALQDDSTIRSRSVGEGLFKKILIYLPGKGRKRAPRKRKNTSAKTQQ